MSEVQTLSGMVEQLGQPKDQSTPEPVSGTEKLIRATASTRERAIATTVRDSAGRSRSVRSWCVSCR